jgi:tRNA G18 (ribose-2'-O)-methylase SpoU
LNFMLTRPPRRASTRSINAGAAGAIVMYEWCRRWA